MGILCSYFKWKKFAKTQFWNSFLEEKGGQKPTHHAATKLDSWYVGNLSNTVISRKQGMDSNWNEMPALPSHFQLEILEVFNIIG